MAHEMFKIANASQETLSIILVGGGLMALFLAALTGFLLWRDKRRGLGRFRQRGTRARKTRRR